MLEVSAGLARARMLTAQQLSRVVRGVADLHLPLPVDPQEPDRPPRWSREMLTAFAGIATSAGPADLALVCQCLPHLLRPYRQRRPSGADNKPEQMLLPGGAAVGAPAPAAETQSSSSALGDARRVDHGESAADSRSADFAVPAVGAGGAAEEERAESSAERSRAAPLHPLVLQAVTAIAGAAASHFPAMTSGQLVGVATGLAAVQFPAGSAWMDAHARSLAGYAPELAEWQVEVVEKAYARMRKCRVKAAAAAAASEQR